MIRTVVFIITIIFCLTFKLSAGEGFVVLEYRSHNSQESIENSYLVKAGDTLAAIVARHFGEVENLNYLFSEIISANPRAFVNGDPNKLLAGSTLVLNVTRMIPRGLDEIYFF